MKCAMYMRAANGAQSGIVKKEKPVKPPVRRIAGQTSEKIELLVRWWKPGSATPKIWLLIAEPSNPTRVK